MTGHPLDDFVLPAGTTFGPLPEDLCSLREGDIVIAPNGTRWRVDSPLRMRGAGRRIHTDAQGYRYLAPGDARFWLLAIR